MNKSYKDYWLQASKRSSKHEPYFAMYDKLFSKLSSRKSLRILEIGVSTGGSIEATATYFANHPNFEIVGLEFNPVAKTFNWSSADINIEIGNAEKLETFEHLLSKYGQFDLIIDDGGHTNLQQHVALKASEFLLKDDGILVIEDVQVSYLAQYGNPSRQSIIDSAKMLVDGMNGRSDILSIPATILSISSIEFSTGMIVFYFSKNLEGNGYKQVNNGIESESTEDYRYHSSGKNLMVSLIQGPLVKALLPYLSHFQALKSVIRTVFVFLANNNDETKMIKLIRKSFFR